LTTQSLQTVVSVEQIDQTTFLGHPTAGPFHRMFGGQLLAQAVSAAGQSVDASRSVTAVRGTFLREGDCSEFIRYTATPILQGKTFSTIRIDGIQSDRLIFTAEVSLQTSPGLSNPPHPAPADLSEQILLGSPFELPLSSDPTEAGDYRSHFDIRPADVVPSRASTVAVAHPSLAGITTYDSQAVWFRLRAARPDTAFVPLATSAALAYASDLTVLQLVKKTKADGVNHPGVKAATLSHSLWWHAVPQLSEWLLYLQDAPRTAGIRGLVFGRIYNSSGALVASIAQEGIARPLQG
jgi:acyl-CoA thioesterase-2